MLLCPDLLLRWGTEVTKGLGRLFDLYKAGLRTRLFIVLPDKKLDKFRTEIERSLFSEIKEIFKVRTYEPLVNLYVMALEHDSRN